MYTCVLCAQSCSTLRLACNHLLDTIISTSKHDIVFMHMLLLYTTTQDSHTHVCSSRSTLKANYDDELDKVAMKANPAYVPTAGEC